MLMHYWWDDTLRTFCGKGVQNHWVVSKEIDPEAFLCAECQFQANFKGQKSETFVSPSDWKLSDP
jgi:hypothetical protein